jgi:hypothetical protein
MLGLCEAHKRWSGHQSRSSAGGMPVHRSGGSAEASGVERWKSDGSLISPGGGPDAPARGAELPVAPADPDIGPAATRTCSRLVVEYSSAPVEDDESGVWSPVAIAPPVRGAGHRSRGESFAGARGAEAEVAEPRQFDHQLAGCSQSRKRWPAERALSARCTSHARAVEMLVPSRMQVPAPRSPPWPSDRRPTTGRMIL